MIEQVQDVACDIACIGGGGEGKSKLLLRLVTYLSPSMPLELYQTYQYYLEEALGCETLLSVETRWSSPPSDKLNPFTEDQVDIGLNTLCSV